MAFESLPALTEKRTEFNYFPTLFQNFIFRNWESVPTEDMARVLGTDVKTVEELAEGFGLRVPAKYNEQYKKRGYITVIRNNWHLLPYSQLLDLLGWDEDELSFTLREDDFFGIKLGQKKPDVPVLKYRPLTDGEKADGVYEEMFRKSADAIKKATSAFSQAFLEYPFCSITAYLGPHHMGPANIMFEKASGLRATMTGYPYDDVEGWRHTFPLETYEKQMRLLSEKWKTGLDLLSETTADNNAAKEFVLVANACFTLLRSSYLQIRYNILRNEYNDGKKENRDEILKILDEELTLTVSLYNAAASNSTIGFEAANHYFFNKYSLAEKIVNIKYLKEYFSK